MRTQLADLTDELDPNVRRQSEIAAEDKVVEALVAESFLEDRIERLTQETGKKVTVEDIEEDRAPRPKVLDMFAGGGAIPLEALRLGCEVL